MSSITPRLFNQQSLCYFEQSSVIGDNPTRTQRGSTTSAGSATGTTIIDTHLAVAADTYNGRYWVKITETGHAATGKWARVVDDDGSGTLTLENNGFEDQIGSGVEYELWKMPDAVAVSDTSGDAASIKDAALTEADDYWIGYYACVISGTYRGEIREITDSTSGDLTVGTAFSGTLGDGDVVLLRKFVEVGSVSDGLTENYIERPGGRVNFSIGDGAITVRGGTFGFNTHLYPSGTLAASGAVASKSVLSGLLAGCGLEQTMGTGATVQAGSTAAAINIATGTWENLGIGQAVVINNEMRHIESITDGGGSDDVLTISPPLSKAPAANDIVHPVGNYTKSTDGDTATVGLEYEVDGVRKTMFNCKGTVVLQAGEALQFAYSFSVGHWIEQVEPAPYNAGTAYTTEPPILAQDRTAWLDTTKVDIKGFTAAPNPTISPKAVQGSQGINGMAGYHVTSYACGGSWRELLDASDNDMDQKIRWDARQAKDVLVTYGVNGMMFGVRVPVARIVQLPKFENGDGMAEMPQVFAAHDAGVANDGDDTSQKVPDFAFFLV